VSDQRHRFVSGAALTLLIAVSGQVYATAQTVETPAAPAAPAALTFEGDTALWTMAIKPDKTGDFETVMRKMREALAASADPQRRRQAEGWKVMKIGKALPDGNIAYVHIIHPVVSGADYTIMQTLYDAFPDERQMLYELYRGAFAQNLALASGSVVVNFAGDTR